MSTGNPEGGEATTRTGGLFDAAPFPPDAYPEAFAAPGRAREIWRPVVDALSESGPGELGRRQARATRMRHEDGATFNPFDGAGGGVGTPWALEIVPLPLAAEEWAAVECGLVQRALLLERVLADVYGPQELLGNRVLPAELVYANPLFRRACHGISPLEGRFLTYYAADLYRGPDGRFRVYRDHAASPLGLGYALENRIVVSRVLSETFHRNQVRRLAPFFKTFHRSLVQWLAAGKENPGVVLLSPGPECPTYFEHALLSRYLGYPLVEGQDLSVRDGRVFLKKLAGLEPVDAVFRFVADDGIDPFSSRGDTRSGVAGLVQALRDRRVCVVNPIGSAFAETPVLPAFLPALCRRLMGAELLLESHPVLWCGGPEGRGVCNGDRARWTLQHALDRSADGVCARSREAVLFETPALCMARSDPRPSTVPVWEAGAVHSRSLLLRVFACATPEGFAVMPGGLAVTAPDAATLFHGDPERQKSKDVWVISDRPVEAVSLMGGLQRIPELRRGSDLPSRVADHLLWLGRYMERAEGRIRLLRSVLRRLAGEARLDDIPELGFLLNLLRSLKTLPEDAQNGGVPGYRELYGQLGDALFRRDRPESVLAVLERVRESARKVRDRLSPDSWRVIDRLEGFAARRSDDALDILDDTLFVLNAFSGLAMESMTRGLGWRFMDMGRRLERAVNQTLLLRAGLSQVCGGEPRGALEALLEVSDSIMTFRARYRTVFQLAPVLDLLIVDESNPKSLAFQCGRLSTHVRRLPRQNDRRFATAEERLVLEMLTTVRLVDLNGIDCGAGGDAAAGLAAFLEKLEGMLDAFARQVTAHYLSRVPALPHFSKPPGNTGP